MPGMYTDEETSMASSSDDNDQDENMSSEDDYTDEEDDAGLDASAHALEDVRRLEELAHEDYETEDDEAIFYEASDTEEIRHTFVDLIAKDDGPDHNLTKTIEEEIEDARICQTDSDDSEDGGVHFCRNRYEAMKDLDDDVSQTSEEGSAVLNFEETEQMRADKIDEDRKARYRPLHNDQGSLGTPAGKLKQ